MLAPLYSKSAFMEVIFATKSAMIAENSSQDNTEEGITLGEVKEYYKRTIVLAVGINL